MLNLNKSLALRDSFSMDNKEIKDTLTKIEIERVILSNFPVLNDEKVLHNYFVSYDFHPNEKDMIYFWREIIHFLFENIFKSFAIPYGRILESCRMKNRRPIGLPNILIGLINQGEYLFASQIGDQEYIDQHYPQYKTIKSWGKWVKDGMKSLFFKSKDQNDFTPNEILINKKLFDSYVDIIIDKLTQILTEEDINVLTVHELKNILRQTLHTDTNLDLALNFLEKVNRIALFKVRVDNTELECVKLLQDRTAHVEEKDQAAINIHIQLTKLDKKIDEMKGVMNDCVEKAKLCLKQNNRQAAQYHIKRKNAYQKNYEHCHNLKFTLEQNLLDLKSMESNKNVKQILEDVVKTSQSLKIDIDNFDMLTDNLKLGKENISGAKDILDNYNNEMLDVIILFNIIQDSSLDEELLAMTNEIKNEKDQIIAVDSFPKANSHLPQTNIQIKNNSSKPSDNEDVK